MPGSYVTTEVDSFEVELSRLNRLGKRLSPSSRCARGRARVSSRLLGHGRGDGHSETDVAKSFGLHGRKTACRASECSRFAVRSPSDNRSTVWTCGVASVPGSIGVRRVKA